MSGFEGELRELARVLEVPEPSRSETLLEVRSDLEAMAAALRARGVEAGEARRRALEWLVPRERAVWELEGVHRPLYLRLVERFSAPGRHRLERGLAVCLWSVQLAWAVWALSAFDLLASPSAMLWPVLGLAAAVATAGCVKLFQLYVVGVHGRERLRRGLTLLLGLGAAGLIVAFGGAGLELYGVAGRLAADPGRQAHELVEWLRRSSGMVSVALLAASGAGLLWLVASVRIGRIEATEAEALRSLTRIRRVP